MLNPTFIRPKNFNNLFDYTPAKINYTGPQNFQ